METEWHKLLQASASCPLQTLYYEEKRNGGEEEGQNFVFSLAPPTKCLNGTSFVRYLLRKFAGNEHIKCTRMGAYITLSRDTPTPA